MALVSNSDLLFCDAFSSRVPLFILELCISFSSGSDLILAITQGRSSVGTSSDGITTTSGTFSIMMTSSSYSISLLFIISSLALSF